MAREVPYPHPGEILAEEFMMPMGVTPYRLAKATNIPQTRVSAILAGVRAITPDTGLRFSRAFGLSDSYWTNLQAAYDLANAKDVLGAELDGIEVLVAT